MKNPLRKKVNEPQAPRTVFRTPTRPHLTHFMVGVAIAIYIAEMVVLFVRGPEAVSQLFDTYGFSLSAVQTGAWWTPFTSIFLHGGADHLFFNVLALYFFGKTVEKVFGRWRWLAVFFSTALVGCAAVLLSSLFGIMPAAVPTIGMSAAIFGLMGAAMLVKPTELVVHPFIIPLPMLVVAAVYIIYNTVAFAEVVVAGAEANVAYAAHFGGLLAGSVFGFKKAGKKQGTIVLFVLLLIFASVPFIWSALEFLQIFNYANALQQLFGG